MPTSLHLRRAAHAVAIPFVALFVAGCAGEPQRSPAELLRARFPEQAEPVLRGAAHRSGLDASLPAEGSAPIVVRAGNGFEVTVTELGAFGEGTAAEEAVAYKRAGGTSFWTATAEGFEEWLLFERGAAFSDRPAASWRVSGATLRAFGEGVAIEDAGGVPQIIVTAPAAFGEDGRPVAVRLHVDGDRIDLWVDTNGAPVLVDPAWKPAAPMPDSRFGHRSALLQNGNVLTVGYATYADIYDPQADTWTPAQNLQNTHYHCTATVLKSGKVLVAGGTNGNTILSGADLYDPTANTWTPTGSLQTARWQHTATLLPDGRVLVAGGSTTNNQKIASAELYDPAAGTWSAAQSLSVPHAEHVAALLPSGAVLVAGGGVNTLDVELYDPKTNMWTAGPALTTYFLYPVSTVLADGRVLVTCGTVNGEVSIYDPAKNTWKDAAPVSNHSIYCTLTTLNDGRVLLAGGFDGTIYHSSADLYDPAQDMWQSGAPMGNARSEHAAVKLKDGRVLVSGGFDGVTFLKTAEIYEAGGPLGSGCAGANECTSGFCVSGVCCESACDAADECHEGGMCASGTGLCTNTTKPDGTPCTGGACHGGQCMKDMGAAGAGGAGSASGAGGGSSTHGAGGGGGSSSSGGGTEKGCGCRLAGKPSGGAAWALLGLALGATRLRRRRAGPGH